MPPTPKDPDLQRIQLQWEHALRKAVLVHVNGERDRGISLDKVKLDLQGIISRALDGNGKDGVDGNGEHDTISAEVIKWTDGFYKRSD